MNVLVTGGAGYIGSHTVLALLEKGYVPIVVDNFSNSSPEAIARVEKITGTKITSYELDVCDSESMKQIVVENLISSAIHFAGYKAVGESVSNPLKYFQNNIDSTISLLHAMNESKTTTNRKVIFSSSATVYGNPSDLPIRESAEVGVGITNPYGFTKFVCEELLANYCFANPDFTAIALRYFNPIGAHRSGLIGEDPKGIPNNIAPYITQVASGKLSQLAIFGGDYDTLDGTGVRDYVHVMDLAEGHVAALNYSLPGFKAVNLGTGIGTSVKELLSAFEKAAGIEIPYKIIDRRAGDIASSFADVSEAFRLFNWKSERTVEEACIDAWRWQSNNPNGY